MTDPDVAVWSSTPIVGGPEQQVEARARRKAAGLPLDSKSWPKWIAEQSMVVAARLVDGTFTAVEADARLKVLERVHRLLSPVGSPGAGRPAKSVRGKAANDPVLASQLEELQSLIAGEEG